MVTGTGNYLASDSVADGSEELKLEGLQGSQEEENRAQKIAKISSIFVRTPVRERLRSQAHGKILGAPWLQRLPLPWGP